MRGPVRGGARAQTPSRPATGPSLGNVQPSYWNQLSTGLNAYAIPRRSPVRRGGLSAFLRPQLLDEQLLTRDDEHLSIHIESPRCAVLSGELGVPRLSEPR